MPNGEGPSLDDVILAAVSAWNLYGLPVVMLLSAMVALRVGGQHASRADARRLGTLHLGLALWAAVWLAGELAAQAGQASFRNVMISAIPFVACGAALDVLIGSGLRRLAPWAWWAALGMAAGRIALGGMFAYLGLRHHATIDPTEWPRLCVSYGFPPLMFVALLLVESRRAFGSQESELATGGRVLRLVLTLALVMLASVILVDLLDLAARALAGQFSGSS